MPCKRAQVTTKQAIMTKIAAALDCSNVSKRKATFILQAALGTVSTRLNNLHQWNN
jgi:hypothetical protein